MKTHLVRPSLVLVLLSLLFSSCKKDSGDLTYFLKYKLNGNWVTMKDVEVYLQLNPQDDTKTDLNITGFNGSQTEQFSIDLRVDSSVLTAGTWRTDNDLLSMTYGKYHAQTDIEVYGNWSVPGKPECLFILTITHVSADEVRGHFTGNYLSDVDDNTVDVTEGEFAVRIE